MENTLIPFDTESVNLKKPYIFDVLKSWSILSICMGMFACIFSSPITAKPAPKVSYILVKKSERKMTVYFGEKLFKEYSISLGFRPIGPKKCLGDCKTPEGVYRITAKNPNSRYHLSLKISYPNASDVKLARSSNVPCGNDIMIHGLGKKFAWVGKRHLLKDWTRGCIAVTNEEIEEIFAATPVGTPIEIRP